MKELQAALKGFTQKNETLKLETKVRLHEILVTFTFMLHVVQVNSVVTKCQGSLLMAIIYSESSVSWPAISTMFLKRTLFFISFLFCSNVAKQVACSAVHYFYCTFISYM